MVEHIYSRNFPHNEIEHYDVLILGGGPAGLTAALYAARYHLKAAVIAKKIGGTAMLAGAIENWPGFTGTGKELMKKFKKQAMDSGAKFLEAEVDNVKRDEDGFVLEINDKEVHGKTIIIALGMQNKKLDLKNEENFIGKGVSYCATCDAAFFKDKVVAVIGGADSAVKAAIMLEPIAKKVYILNRRDKMKSEPALTKKLEKKRKIEVLYNTIITKLNGKNKLENITIQPSDLSNGEADKEKKKLEVDGIFIEIGATPVNEVVNELKLETNGGHIKTDKQSRTNIPGAFAAGDNTDNKFKQVVTAAGEGAVAARAAYDYLKFEYKEKK
ncbi:MAG: FAD-dependent oxidoreductase [archaeon]